jgi:antitoxin component of MazEF toxin-antitoxin module
MPMIVKPIRSLVDQGGSLVLTLPKEWITKHGLQKGQYVKLEEDGDALVVLPWKEEKNVHG